MDSVQGEGLTEPLQVSTTLSVSTGSTPMQEEEAIRKTLRRCTDETIEAAIAYRASGEAAHVPIVVLGVIERFIEPEVRPLLSSGRPDIRLAEDLGIDSLIMVEIVMVVEEALTVTLNNDDLRELQTLGDLKAYVQSTAATS